jgi:RNA polymerase-binding transcription factor DksA
VDPESAGILKSLGEQKASMTKTELSRFQTILNARIIELEQLIRHRDGIRVEREAPINWKKSSKHWNVHSHSIKLTDTLAICETSGRLSVATMLREPQGGSFGICQGCGDDISLERRVAAPWAQFCIRCQEAVDRSLEEIQAPGGDLLGRAP